MNTESQPNQTPNLLTPADVAERLRVTRTWIYNEIKSGRLPSFRVGKLARVTEQDLSAYLEARRRAPVAPRDAKGGA